MAHRRKIIVRIATSADGLIARSDGSFDWLDQYVLGRIVHRLGEERLHSGLPFFARRAIHAHDLIEARIIDGRKYLGKRRLRSR
jgi:hypothetical protein